MIPFMAMLQGGAGAAGGNRLAEAMGKQGASQPKGDSSSKYGMQFANKEMNPDPIPNMLSMLSGMTQVGQMANPQLSNQNKLLQMLINGG